MAEGRALDPTEIVEYLDTEALDEVSKQVDKEYSQVYKLIQENKYPSDPFIRGFYEYLQQFHGSLQMAERNTRQRDGLFRNSYGSFHLFCPQRVHMGGRQYSDCNPRRDYAFHGSYSRKAGFRHPGEAPV